MSAMTKTVAENKNCIPSFSVLERAEKARDPYDGLRFWSAFTHGMGAGLSAVCGVALLAAAVLKGVGAQGVVALSVYIASMILLYLASCLYHCVNTSVRGRILLRKLDHAMIYVLIAGTYTPICLSVLDGALGWALFGVIWGLAFLGVIVTMFWLNAPRKLTTLFYVGMGWIAVLAMEPLVMTLCPVALAWMLAGGVAYTVGGAMYALKWPLRDGVFFGCHEVFHVFVLLGSTCFYIMMWLTFAV